MSLLTLLGISNALAATPTTPQSPAGGLLSMLPMLLIIVVVFYFLFVRPQTKRAKEHQQMLQTLSVGDEIITTGGIAGRLARITENFLVLEIAKGVEINIQKNAIGRILPKGTLDAIK